MSRRLVAFMLCALLLVPGAALARATYFCKMSGRVGRSCCCKHLEKKAKQAPSAPSVSRPPCCTTQAVPDDGRAASIAHDASIVPAAVLALLPATWGVQRSPLSLTLLPAQARGPPPLGPPLYLRNCAFLT